MINSANYWCDAAIIISQKNKCNSDSQILMGSFLNNLLGKHLASSMEGTRPSLQTQTPSVLEQLASTPSLEVHSASDSHDSPNFLATFIPRT